MHKALISIVLGSYNRFQFLPLTVESIRRELAEMSHEIIVVDGGSTDGSLEWLVEQKDIITILQHNRGQWRGKAIERRSWGYFMNLGFKITRGKYVCMLSDDCLVVPGAILNGYRFFEEELFKGRKLGAVAFYWRDWPLDREYRVGVPANKFIYVNHGLYLREALHEVGYIDEESYSFYFGDIDLCFKLWNKGYECCEAPDSYVEHYPFSNTVVRASNNTKHLEDYQNFLRKWQPIFIELTNRNLGELRKKSFKDTSRTGERFRMLHNDVLKQNPEIGKLIASKQSWSFVAQSKRLWNGLKQKYL